MRNRISLIVAVNFSQEKIDRFFAAIFPMIIYRMVIVEGRCDQLTWSSLHTHIIIGWHKSIVSSDWSDTMVWFGQILLLLYFYHPIYIILEFSWAREEMKMMMIGTFCLLQHWHFTLIHNFLTTQNIFIKKKIKYFL